MPRVRDLLLRFRPSGSPGSAGPAGMPVDRTSRLAAELEPVFAALAATERECTAVVEQARRTAAGTRAAMVARAEQLRASAPALAEAERRAAAAEPAPGLPGPPGAARPTGAELRTPPQDPLLAALVEHAATAAPHHLAEVAAAVESLCTPEPGPS